MWWVKSSNRMHKSNDELILPQATLVLCSKQMNTTSCTSSQPIRLYNKSQLRFTNSDTQIKHKIYGESIQLDTSTRAVALHIALIPSLCTKSIPVYLKMAQCLFSCFLFCVNLLIWFVLSLSFWKFNNRENDMQTRHRVHWKKPNGRTKNCIVMVTFD